MPLLERLEARTLFSGPGAGPGTAPALPTAHDVVDMTMITSFGSVVTTDAPLSGPYQFPFAGGQAKDELVQPDGKRLIAGYAGGNIAIARFNADGTLDTTFGGGDGKSVNDLGTPSDRALNMSLRADGKIVLMGVTGGSGDTWQFVALRLGADGALDSTFADNGKLFSGLGRAPTYGGVSTVLRDGRIHITGWDGGTSQAMEYDADGKNGFDRMASANALRAQAATEGEGFSPVVQRPGTLGWLAARSDSLGPVVIESEPMRATSEPTVDEGADYVLELSRGNEWQIHWESENPSDPTVSLLGHPASTTHVYPDGYENGTPHTITATSKGIYLKDGDRYAPAATRQTIDLDSLTLEAGTALDVDDNDLIVQSGDFSAIQSLVFEGYSATVNAAKTGITSSAGQDAAGTTILALFNKALFDAQEWPLGSGNTIATSAVVGKYTYIGDCDWDGAVTPADATAIDSNLGTMGVDPGAAWLLGDTDFDYNITPADYTGIDSSLGLGVGEAQVSGMFETAVEITQEVTVHNVAPTPTISGSTTATVGTPITLNSIITDPSPVDQAAPLALGWSVTKDGVYFDGEDDQAAFTFTPTAAGTYVVTLSARDKDLKTGTSPAFVVTVTDSNAFTLVGSAVSATNISLGWTTVESADQYRIEISSDGSDFFGSSLIEPGQTDYEFSGFDAGELFTFRAIAISGGTDVATSNLLTINMPGQLSGDQVASQPLIQASASAPSRRLTVGFNGYYVGNNPLDSVGNMWFERIIRDDGNSTRGTSNQKSYNFADRKVALADVYNALDTNDNLVISQQEIDDAKVVVLGYSLGGVEAANFGGLLAKTGNIHVGSELYVVQAPVRVALLATMDPVTGGVAIFRNYLRLPKGRITTNVQRFVNYYETKGGNASFRLYLPGSSNNGSNFNSFYKVADELLTSPFSPVINGAALQYDIPAANVKQLRLNNAAQVPAGRYSANVNYFGYDPTNNNRQQLILQGPSGSDNYDADLRAPGVEHLSIPWYVRGGTAANMDPLVNLMKDIANA